MLNLLGASVKEVQGALNPLRKISPANDDSVRVSCFDLLSAYFQ